MIVVAVSNVQAEPSALAVPIESCSACSTVLHMEAVNIVLGISGCA